DHAHDTGVCCLGEQASGDCSVVEELRTRERSHITADVRRGLIALLLVLAACLLPSEVATAAVVPQADQGLNGGWANAETVVGGSGDNTYVRNFAQLAVAVLVQHFVGRISEWEVWNEPNAWTSTDGNGHFSGATYMYPTNYAWLCTT